MKNERTSGWITGKKRSDTRFVDTYKFFLGKRKELMRLGGMVDSYKNKKKGRERKKKES